MKTTLALFCLLIFMQTNPYSKWDKKDLEKANTGKDAAYLTDEERRVITLINLARINPPLFAQTVLENYLDSVNYKGSAYVNSLKKDLLSSKALPPLQVSKDLFDAAESHANNMGNTGKVGHENFEKRYEGIAKKYFLRGENCHYGSDKAMKIVMALLIDEGKGDAPHRKNILHKEFTVIGTAIRSHKAKTWNCVQAFAGKEKEK
jgi:uncharacterized protein YkwD